MITLYENCLDILYNNNTELVASVYTIPLYIILLSFYIVFTSVYNQWSVSNVMDSEDMKKKDQYGKILFNRLSEGSRKFQVLERVLPEYSPVNREEEQVTKLKQQIKQENEAVSRDPLVYCMYRNCSILKLQRYT